MELLSLEAVAQILNQAYQDTMADAPELADDLDDLRLIRHAVFPEQQRNQLLAQFPDLPNDFLDCICAYDFGRFTIRQVQFGHTGDYFAELLERNSAAQPWFDELQASRTLLLGAGDPYAVLLDREDGSITAAASDAPIAQKWRIAPSFSHLLRGLGTAFWAVQTDDAEAFLQLAEQNFGASALDFWCEQV